MLFRSTPASELVVFGGAIMVSADAVSKYALAKSLMQRTNPRTNKKYTMHEAHMEANATFIDYRQNVPKEVKMLSDYGILMFPSFWLRAQKVIAGLIRYHPGTALASYIAESMMGIGGINFLDTNIINKITDGQIINDPTNLIDWDIMSPWL